NVGLSTVLAAKRQSILFSDDNMLAMIQILPPPCSASCLAMRFSIIIAYSLQFSAETDQFILQEGQYIHGSVVMFLKNIRNIR
ncbi:MAG: hypothetical protein LUI10_07375, partial [Lachnospiraceae bacterium]|nr:hypothetical protein [Lachnospiraceae bacterium]